MARLEATVRAGVNRSLQFKKGPERIVSGPIRRWWVWWYQDDVWHRMVASMPEGACASYADVERRFADAICMEAA